MSSRRLREALTSLSNVSSNIRVFLPSQDYAIACMEGEYNIVSNVVDTITAICRRADGLVELIGVLNIGYRGSILSTFVINVDLYDGVGLRI